MASQAKLIRLCETNLYADDIFVIRRMAGDVNDIFPAIEREVMPSVGQIVDKTKLMLYHVEKKKPRQSRQEAGKNSISFGSGVLLGIKKRLALANRFL